MSMILGLIEDLKRVKRHIDPLEKDMFVCSTVESMKIIDTAIDIIETLSAKLAAANMERSERYYNGGWIACEDRLPSEDEGVLIWIKYRLHGGTHDGEYAEQYGVGHINYNSLWLDSREYGVIRGEVLAWQPLPQPYQGE